MRAPRPFIIWMTRRASFPAEPRALPELAVHAVAVPKQGGRRPFLLHLAVAHDDDLVEAARLLQPVCNDDDLWTRKRVTRVLGGACKTKRAWESASCEERCGRAPGGGSSATYRLHIGYERLHFGGGSSANARGACAREGSATTTVAYRLRAGTLGRGHAAPCCGARGGPSGRDCHFRDRRCSSARHRAARGGPAAPLRRRGRGRGKRVAVHLRGSSATHKTWACGREGTVG